MRREDHRHARRRDGAVHHVDRPGGLGRRRGAGVGFDQRAVLGDVAQDAGTQRGHRQPQLQAGTGDELGVDGPDPVLAAVPERALQRVQIEDRAAAAAQVTPDAGQPEAGAGHQPGQVTLPLPPGPPGLAPAFAAGVARRHDLVAGKHGRGGQGERRPGALGDLLVDLAAQRGPVERAEPGLLAEHVVGLRPGQHITLDLVHTVEELGERAGLRQDGGSDGAGRRGRDDVGGDPLDADQVLQHADLEGALGAAAGQHEGRRA